jgi:hypothetical protein
MTMLALCAAMVSMRMQRVDAAPPAQKKESFSIVQVDGEYTVVPKAGLKVFQKALNERFAAAVKAHQQARKEAVKNKQKFTEPPPKRPAVRTLPRVFDSEEAASAYVQQLKEEDEKKKAAAAGN